MDAPVGVQIALGALVIGSFCIGHLFGRASAFAASGRYELGLITQLRVQEAACSRNHSGTDWFAETMKCWDQRKDGFGKGLAEVVAQTRELEDCQTDLRVCQNTGGTT